jgi:hypothetical protein
MSNEVIESTAIVERNESILTPEIKALLAQSAEQQAVAETNTIPFISLKGKKFSIGDDKLGTVLKTIILADVFDNSWYDRPYDAGSDEVYPPACFAVYKELSDASPHKDSPVAQSDNCDGCPKNEFGSKGKGKACRNGRRILIASVGDDGRVNFGDLAIINMSPTALKGFSKYTKSVSTLKKLPLWAVHTTLSFDDDAAYPVLAASFDGPAHGDDITRIATLLDTFNDAVSIPYDTSNYEPPTSAATSEAQAAKKSKMS